MKALNCRQINIWMERKKIPTHTHSFNVPNLCPVQMAQLVRAFSIHQRGCGFDPSQGTYLGYGYSLTWGTQGRLPINVSLPCCFLSFSLSLSLLLSLKLINICSGEDLKKKEVSSLFGHRYRSLHLLVVIQRGAVVSIYGKSNVILKVRVLQHQKKPISCQTLCFKIQILMNIARMKSKHLCTVT